jgi:hypothetical protein
MNPEALGEARVNVEAPKPVKLASGSGAEYGHAGRVARKSVLLDELSPETWQ